MKKAVLRELIKSREEKSVILPKKEEIIVKKENKKSKSVKNSQKGGK